MKTFNAFFAERVVSAILFGLQEWTAAASIAEAIRLWMALRKASKMEDPAGATGPTVCWIQNLLFLLSFFCFSQVLRLSLNFIRVSFGFFRAWVAFICQSGCFESSLTVGWMRSGYWVPAAAWNIATEWKIWKKSCCKFWATSATWTRKLCIKGLYCLTKEACFISFWNEKLEPHPKDPFAVENRT